MNQNKLQEVMEIMENHGQVGGNSQVPQWPLLNTEELKMLEIYRNYMKFGEKDTIKKIATREIQDKWSNILSLLIHIQLEKGYFNEWLVNVMHKIKPPLPIWEELSKHLGYNQGWAYRNYYERQMRSKG
jgi:hypothetical protein